MVMQRELTLDQFLALPEAKPGFEFVRGEAVQKPVTNADHIRIVWRLAAAFHAHAREHGGAGGPEGSVAFTTSRGVEILLPDFAFWAAGVEMGSYPLNPPTLAVEVRSPSQSPASQREKCEFYVEHGVSEAWLIDPDQRRAQVITAANRTWSDVTDALEPACLPGFKVAISAVLD